MHACRHAGMQACRHAGMQACRQAGRHACMQAGRQACRQACMQAGRQACRHAVRNGDASHAIYPNATHTLAEKTPPRKEKSGREAREKVTKPNPPR